MHSLIHHIFDQELNQTIESIDEITDLGSVNRVFAVKGKHQPYIIRLNDDPHKVIEYQKEKWCLDTVAKLGIPSPTVLGQGHHDDHSFMIMNKIVGTNGKLCSPEIKAEIWQQLGSYSAKFQTIQRIEDKATEEDEFHTDWQARLEYNILELNDNDLLLKSGALNSRDHHKAKKALTSLVGRSFDTGLVHGDLCPRNTIYSDGVVYLLDWGTAEINVVPHSELGILEMSKEASVEEFNLFLEGMSIASAQFVNMRRDIELFNLLHRLDKYRWAQAYDKDTLRDYAEKVRECLARVNIIDY